MSIQEIHPTRLLQTVCDAVVEYLAAQDALRASNRAGEQALPVHVKRQRRLVDAELKLRELVGR